MVAKRIGKLIILLLLGFFVAANVYFIFQRVVYENKIPKIFGLAQLIVVSGSMQPAIEVGDMIIIKAQKAYSVDDIVTFRAKHSLVTHRIVEINDTYALTKGDKNNVTDEPVPLSNIEGKLVARIPRIGNIMLFGRTPRGIISLALGALIILAIPNLLKRLKGMRI